MRVPREQIRAEASRVTIAEIEAGCKGMLEYARMVYGPGAFMQDAALMKGLVVAILEAAKKVAS